MAKYVTVDFFKQHSYVDAEASDDEYIEHLLRVAESSVEKFVQRPLSELEVPSGDSASDGSDSARGEYAALPPEVIHAILLRAADLYENRESLAPAQIHVVPGTFYEMLTPFRKIGGSSRDRE